MRKKPEKSPENRPVLIEVPKPVNQMTQAEKDAFVEEMLNAIYGERNWKIVRFWNTWLSVLRLRMWWEWLLSNALSNLSVGLGKIDL